MKEAASTEYEGGCLCGNVRFCVHGIPSFPHLCSCRMCQAWSGAPVVAWVEFPLVALEWIGPGGEPSMHKSSKRTSRGFCAKCGGTLCAIDEGYENISLTLASFENPSQIVPDEQYSFEDMAPDWLNVAVGKNGQN
ncbi:MAG: GFA family protein [Rhizobiaceae bacterium]